MGISLIHDLSAIPLAYWLAPAGTVTSLMLVAGLALEVHKFKVGGRSMESSSIVGGIDGATGGGRGKGRRESQRLFLPHTRVNAPRPALPCPAAPHPTVYTAGEAGGL